MTSFEYELKDPNGLHARPASEMIKIAKAYKSTITIVFGTKKADAKRLFAIMSLGTKQGSQVRFDFDGEDEKEACTAVKAFVEEHF